MTTRSLLFSRFLPRLLPRAMLIAATIAIVLAPSRRASAQFTPGWGDTNPIVGPLADLGIPSYKNNSAVAIPPNRGGCGANGALTVARGDSWNGALVSSNNLSCARFGTNCATSTRNLADVHVQPSGVSDHFEETGHNGIVRLGNNTLVVARMLVRYAPAVPFNRRGMVAFFSSTDCGNSWQEISQIDPWMTFSPWDYQAGSLYADPWRPSRLFFIAEGNFGDNQLFISTDGGYSWGTPFGLPSDVGIGCKVTTMPSGDAYFLCLWSTFAEISRYSPDTGWSPGRMIVASDVAGLSNSNHGIARIGRFPDGDYLRVTYPYNAGSGQTTKIGVRHLAVKVAGDTATVTKTKSLTGPGTANIWSAQLVETDRFEMPSTSMENSALLYWNEEANNCATPKKMKAMLVRDYDSWTAPIELDPYQGGHTCTGQNTLGESLRGGFFYDQSTRHLDFVAQWGDVQTNAGVTGISARVLSYFGNGTPVESFRPFESLGMSPAGAFVGSPAISSWGQEHLDVFGIGHDSSLQHRTYDNGVWGPTWENVIPGTIASSVAAVSSQKGQIDVVVKGNDVGLWYATWLGSWQGWTPLGKPADGTVGFRGEPAITSWAPGRLDAFANTTTGTWHRGCSSSCLTAANWSAWENLGEPSSDIDGGVGAISTSSGHIDIFDIKASDKSLVHKSFDLSTGWSDWDSLGGTFGVTNSFVTPAVSSRVPGHWDLFALATNGFVHHKSVEPSSYLYTNWLSSSGVDLSGSTGQVAVTSPGPNRMHQVVVLPNGNMWHSKTTYTRVVPVDVDQSTVDFGGEPERAADGDIDGEWRHNSVTHTKNEYQPYWWADLGATTDVSFIDVYNRTDCCADRLTNFNVAISQDGTTWTTFNTPGQAGSPTSVWIKAPARYVKVQLVGTNFLSLAELSVWAP